MAAEYLNTWSPASKVAAHTALIGVIDGAATAGTITIHDSSDTLLATVTLDDPCGTVDGGTGELTLVVDVQEDDAPASGTASYATIRDGDGDAHASIPCQVGGSAVTGYCVLNTLEIVAGGSVTVVSATVL